MPGFQPIDLVGNYFAGRQAVDQERAADTRNALGRQELDYRKQQMSQQQQTFSDEQKRQFATQMVQAAQYGIQSQSPKAFIEQNYPQLAQLAGPQWAQLDDEAVRGKLQEALGVFGPQAGIGPAPAPKRYETITGPRGSRIQRDPVTGEEKQIVGPDNGHAIGMMQPPAGYRYNPDGSLAFIPGGPSDPNRPQPDKPPTESDKKARVLLSSMDNAEADIAKLSNVDTGSLLQRGLGSTALTAPLQSDDFRKYEAAGLRWAANLLYLKSGATATPDEIRSTWKQFFPQVGDGEGAKQQKAQARAQEVAAIKGVYTPEAVQALAAPQQRPSTGGGPVRVNSPQEAMSLPSGTVFMTPDGRTKVRP